MSFISGLAELEGLEQIVARAGSLQRTERVVGEAERASTVLSDHALDLGIAGRRQARSGAASAEIPADPDLGGSRIAEMLGNDRSHAGAGRVGSEPIADTLGDAILSNPVIQDLPYRFQGLAVDAMKVHARALAEPLAKDSGAANVLAHHFGLRATGGEIKDVLETVARHGGVNEATPAIQQLSKMDPRDLKAESLLTQWSHPDDPLAHFSNAPARKVITPVDQAAARNPNIGDVPISRRDAVEDGVAMWARTIAHPLANGPEAAELLATRLAGRADQNDVRSIDAMMRSAGSTEKGLDLVADVARYERNMSGVVPLADLPEGVPYATEPNGYWVPGVGYRQEGRATGVAETARDVSSLPARASIEPGPDRQPLNILAAGGLPVDGVNLAAASNIHVTTLSPMDRSWAVNGVARYSRELAQPATDPVSVEILASKIASGLTKRQVSDAANTAVSHGTLDTKTVVLSELDRMTRQADALDPKRLEALGVPDTAVGRAAFLNQEMRAVEPQQPWKVAPTVIGLQQYARVFAAEVAGDVHSMDQISKLIASTASPNDVWRIYDIMKTAKTQEGGLRTVARMALDDYDGLLYQVEQPLSPTIVRRPFGSVPSELLDGTDGPVARALESVKRGSEVDTAIPPVSGLPVDVFLRPGETSAEPLELEFAPLPRQTGAVLSPGRGVPADTSSSSVRESAPPPRRARPGGAVKNPTPDGVEALAWDKP